MTQLAIETRGLTKRFNKTPAVDAVDLKIPEGKIFGFIGPNGSGKSTTMKMLLGLSRPDAGEAFVLGEKITERPSKRLIHSVGSMIETPSGYGHLTGAENMKIMQRALGLPSENIHRALETVHLTKHQNKLVKQYSLGMKQRLGIAMALARNPKLLILDEPTNGLDPAGIDEIRSLLLKLAHQGVTIFVSSHLLDELDKMVDLLGIIMRGKLIFQGTRQELMGRSIPDLLLRVSAPETVLAMVPEAQQLPNGTIRVPNVAESAAPVLNARLVSRNIDVFEFARAHQTLEDVFLDLTEEGGLK
ncbi:ABC transporter ATP-binding protein [Corynebacterium freiburgense]|uniref:ABC transporter ATP-binding protein n=1 Tax=Corynebacterium freiburgense TaxID=556548 RepID=UPI000415E455|nr:ABC transporter ATP-binding protein [Corynebacterium freiburgense]WJZ02487.1 Daunorubicin/doxorubicin resistance ATP-binding protein DrrA [Corynebacterium freiburgense]